MELVFWIFVFALSVFALLKGADWLLESAEKLGLAMGMSKFVLGVIIVGLGTSFPEIVSSFVAVIQGVPEIVPANVIGSNIANIFLVIGISAIVGGKLVVSKDLINLELPLLAASTAMFLAVAYDGKITVFESVLLLLSFAVYLSYSIFHKDESVKGDPEELRSGDKNGREQDLKQDKISYLKEFAKLSFGILILAGGAKFLIDSVIELSAILNVAVSAISLFAIAVGTSLPELIVSVKAVFAKNTDLALGNIFGSNAFNLLIVVGAPGLFGTLPLDQSTKFLGLSALFIATFLLIISGISKRIYNYEGAMYLALYVLFIGKLFGFIA